MTIKAESMIYIEGEIDVKSPPLKDSIKTGDNKGTYITGPVTIRTCGSLMMKGTQKVWIQPIALSEESFRVQLQPKTVRYPQPSPSTTSAVSPSVSDGTEESTC